MEHFLKMVIEMNEQKILSDGEYKLKSVYDTIVEIFNDYGLDKVKSFGNRIVAIENGDNQDLARFFLVMRSLKHSDWFMDNCLLWKFYEYDEKIDEGSDCLAFYKGKREEERMNEAV